MVTEREGQLAEMLDRLGRAQVNEMLDRPVWLTDAASAIRLARKLGRSDIARRLEQTCAAIVLAR